MKTVSTLLGKCRYGEEENFQIKLARIHELKSRTKVLACNKSRHFYQYRPYFMRILSELLA